MLVAALPPACVTAPRAYNVLPDTASADTSLPNCPPDIPEPRADQLLPFHCAMLVAALPPAVVKWPPAYNVPPDTASASTPGAKKSPPEIPDPRADQLLPFHWAI